MDKNLLKRKLQLENKSQFGNAVTFKIIIVRCVVKIINCEKNQLSIS